VQDGCTTVQEAQKSATPAHKPAILRPVATEASGRFIPFAGSGFEKLWDETLIS